MPFRRRASAGLLAFSFAGLGRGQDTGLSLGTPGPANSPTYSGYARTSVVADACDFSYGTGVRAVRGCPVGKQSIQCRVNPTAFTLAAPGTYRSDDTGNFGMIRSALDQGEI